MKSMARTKASPSRPDVPAATGTYFLSLTVENVRCFGRAQTLDLSDGHGGYAPWTIILGENGLGKTTLLTCLAYAGSRGFLHSDVIGAHLSEWFQRQKLLVRSNSVLGRVHASLVSSDNAEMIDVISVKLQRHSPIFSITPHQALQDLLVYHYGASRRMPRGGIAVEDDDRVGIFLDDDVVLRDPEVWLLNADHNARLRGPDGRRFSRFLRRAQEALVDLLPEVSDLRIQSADEPGGAPRVEAKTPDGWVPLRQLGFGYQSQIAWLVDLASRMFERYSESTEPLAEPAVVLVDEIDLHMHPRWQRQIIEFLALRFPKTQFIVTAHSPLIVQAASGANIVLLRREGDHVVIDNDPAVLRNWRVDQILTSELFGLESARPPQIEEPLKERRALLAKPTLTARDRKRLGELEQNIGDLPAGESAEDRRAMELIRQAAAKLSGDA
jgi:hypothetical protein